MKTLISKSNSCKEVRRNSRCSTTRIQTYQVRAARSRVKELLKTAPIEYLDDILPQKVSVDYYS